MTSKLPDVLTEEEISKIVKKAKNIKDKLALMLGFYQAMRVSEVVALQPENIDYDRKLIMIKGAKGDKDRNIPIAPEVINGLKFLPITVGKRALQHMIKRLGYIVLDKDIHFHTLRHSGATHYMNEKDWKIRFVQDFLGHSSLQTTQIYTHVSPKQLVEKMWN